MYDRYVLYLLLGICKNYDMIHIINFIVKGLVTVILFFPIGGCLTLLTLVFWDAKYLEIGNEILEKMIWKKR